MFAEALIEAIQDRQADKDGDGYIKSLDLFSFVQNRVSDRAKKLFNLKQTPDYGYFPGDGSGDLVISLREGAFNRLIEDALWAMLRHDVPRLEDVGYQAYRSKPGLSDNPLLGLQAQVHARRHPCGGATCSALRDLILPPGTLPLHIGLGCP